MFRPRVAADLLHLLARAIARCIFFSFLRDDDFLRGLGDRLRFVLRGSFRKEDEWGRVLQSSCGCSVF